MKLIYIHLIIRPSVLSSFVSAFLYSYAIFNSALRYLYEEDQTISVYPLTQPSSYMSSWLKEKL